MPPKCKCGKQLTDMRGAKGHVKFRDDEMHGPVGTVRDDWRELFEEADAEPEQEPPEQEQEADEDGDRDEPDQSPEQEPPSRESQSEPSQSKESKGRIHQFLTTPIDELFN